jgi:hypothetical protein
VGMGKASGIYLMVYRWRSGVGAVGFPDHATDPSSRYGKELWKLASVILKPSEIPANYGYRKVWQFGLEVAMKIKGSQGRR